MDYKNIFEPGMIGSVRTKNRMIKMGAHPGFYEYEDGFLNSKEVDYYEGIAKGGIGLLTIGAPPIGDPPVKGYRLDDEKYIPGMKELTDKIHACGIPAFIQQFHIGPWIPKEIGGVSPSALSYEERPVKHDPDTEALTTERIEEIIQEVIDQSVLAKKCGFDGVEINTACHHLFDQFLSRAFNKRTDEYGGSLENRARLVVEIIKGIKKANGDDFAIIALMNAAEPGLPDGLTLEEGIKAAKMFEAAGVDALNVRNELYIPWPSTGGYGSTHFPEVAFYPETTDAAVAKVSYTKEHGRAGWMPVIKAVKKEVNIPIIGSGRIDAEMGEKLLKEGVLDFVNTNRRVMADPEYPRKIQAGHHEDIVPCTACMTCWQAQRDDREPECRINAALGKGKEFAELKPAEKKKKVVVIGGGPAGMEAAWTAAKRGHKVTLIEKGKELGGSMNLAVVVKSPHRENLLLISKYLETRCKKSGVEIIRGKKATKEMVQNLNPDVIIVAVGAKHDVPDIPGMKGRNVMDSEKLHSMLKFFLKFTGASLMAKLVQMTNFLPMGKKIILMGGALQGCQTAEFLIEHGRDVVIVEPTDEIGDQLLPDLLKPNLLEWLDKKGTKKYTGVTFNEVTKKGLVITTSDGEKVTLEGSTVVTAMPLLPNKDLFESLQGVAPEIYTIGDCDKAGLIVDAVADGARIGRQI